MTKLEFTCSGKFLPKRATEHSAGIDLYNNDQTVHLEPNFIQTINTKVRMAIPEGHVGLLFVRSSMAGRDISLANSVGVIDSDYRGDIKAKVVYRGNEPFETIEYGERFLQLVIVEHANLPLKQVDTLDETARGEGGFGSTGRK